MEHVDIEGAFKPGQLIGDRHEVIRLLGRGGMGEVYLVRDTISQKRYALKLLHREMARDPKLLARFRQESEITSRFDHPNIVKTFEFGSTLTGELFFVMEYLEGTNLLDHLESCGPLSIEGGLAFLRQIAGALSYAHEHNIVHRDLKPENILVAKDGLIKILDFGIALDQNQRLKLTKTGQPAGTLLYIAPEQLQGDELDCRCDIYNFGLLAYVMIVGNHPFDKPTDNETYIAQLRDDVPRMSETRKDVPLWFNNVVAKCTEKDRARRFQSMHQVMKLLAPSGAASVRTRLNARTWWTNRSASLHNITFAVVVAFVALLVSVPIPHVPYSGFLGIRLEPKVTSFWLLLRGPRPPPEEIQLVIVDEESYRRVGGNVFSAYPRDKLAEAIRTISQSGPRAMFLDFLFFDKSSNPETDRNLAAAFASGPVFIAKLASSNLSKWYHPLDIFRGSAKEISANVKLTFDAVRYFFIDPSEVPPTLPMAHFLGVAADPYLPGPRDFINYYGPPGTFPRVYLHDLLAANPDRVAEVIKGRHVLIGSEMALNSADDKDRHMIPYGEKMVGVEIHATIAANLLDKSYIRRLPLSYECIALSIVATLLGFAILSVNLAAALGIVAGSAILWLVLSYISFLHYYFLPGGILFLSGLPLHYATSAVRLWFKKRQDDRLLLGKRS